jgi:3-methyladenine DNA glycosylase AlkD
VTHPLVRKVRRRLRERADPDRAAPMQAYMKSAMPFLGVTGPAQHALWRELFAAPVLPSFDEWRTVVLALWREARYREERYAAIALADHRAYRSFRTAAAVPMLEEMIVSGAWWDFVDALATHHLGDVLEAELHAGRGAAIRRLLLTWARGDDLWKRRAAILCQIRFKQNTDTRLLYACIEPSLIGGSKGTRPTGARDIRHDFFIRKAIGWSLRQYAWTEPDEVRRYVDAHRERLSPLSVREALKNLSTTPARRARSTATQKGRA